MELSTPLFNVLDLSKYIINKCTIDDNPISNLQLQNILYFIQREFLKLNKLAFVDDIEAWSFGPVVRKVYNIYCGFGASKIKLNYNVCIDSTYRSLVDKIIHNKRILKPWSICDDILVDDKAWKLTYNKGLGDHRVIPIDLILTKG